MRRRESPNRSGRRLATIAGALALLLLSPVPADASRGGLNAARAETFPAAPAIETLNKQTGDQAHDEPERASEHDMEEAVEETIDRIGPAKCLVDHKAAGEQGE